MFEAEIVHEPTSDEETIAAKPVELLAVERLPGGSLRATSVAKRRKMASLTAEQLEAMIARCSEASAEKSSKCAQHEF